MKKLITLLFLLVLFFRFTQVNAQGNKVALGLEIGPALTWSHGSEGLQERTDNAKRIFTGLSFQYNLNTILSIHSGMAYEQKGHVLRFLATDNNGNPIGEASAHGKFSYLTVPIILRTTFGNKFKYFVNLGPFAGLSLSHKVDIELPNGERRQEDYSETFKPNDFGISAGAGISFPVTPQLDFSVEIRNNLGLYDIDTTQAEEAGPFRTNSLNLLFGLSYKLGLVE